MEELKREVIPMMKKFVEVRSKYLHREGTNDYTKDKIIIEEIVDKTGQKVNPVWGKDWREVVRGIETREDSDCQYVRIYRQACPVRIRFQKYYEYASYDDSEHSCIDSCYYWVEYEAGGFKI